MAAYASSLALSMLLTRWLDLEGYGIYIYAVALISLLGMLGQMGAPTLIMREAALGEVQGNWAYLRALLFCSVRMTTLMATLLMTLSFCLLWFLPGQFPEQQIETLIWLLWLLPFMVFRRIVAATLRGLHKVIISQTVDKIIAPVLLLLVLGFLFVLFPQTHHPQYVALTQLVVGIVVTCMACFVLWRQLPKVFWQEKTDYGYAQWLRATLPFMLISGSALIITQTDILMLGFFQPIEQAGIYRIAAYISALVLLGQQVIVSLIAHPVAKMYVQKNRQPLQRFITINTRLAFAFALCVAFVLFIFGQDIIVIIFGAGFSTAATSLKILLVGALVSVAMGPVGLLVNMAGYEKYALRFLLYGALLNILLNALLIPVWGMVGAALATATSLSLRNVLLYRTLKIKTGIDSHVFFWREGSFR